MFHSLRQQLFARPAVAVDPLLAELAVVLTGFTGTSTATWPYLSGHVWARFRDWVPHLMKDGAGVLDGVDRLLLLCGECTDDPAALANAERAASVIRQVVLTCSVTAPPELWLLRGVLSALERRGLLDRFRRDEIVHLDGSVGRPDELRPDLTLLLARGLVGRAGQGYRWLELPGPQRVLREITALPAHWPSDLSARWRGAILGEDGDHALLTEVLAEIPSPAPRTEPAWLASPEDLELGWRLVPFILGLRAANRTGPLLAAPRVDAEVLAPLPPPLAERALTLLRRVGAIDAAGHWTRTGRRTLSRGPGPFGIIEAYHPYLAALDRIWDEGRGAFHVERGANIAASQDANRRTFQRANDALDAFCAETGFRYPLFIEHAVGMGEATRQRHARSGDALIYVGADLEDTAINAAIAEREAGRLPAGMRFVRKADIGAPAVLIDQLRAWGLQTQGAVMVVGNGFHEVRARDDAHMVAVFAAYQAAGIVLLFTEESALSVDDLLETAWNTYHGAFRYVHERSGQVLRPATVSLPSAMDTGLPASWTECAQRAGYVRVDKHSSRSRTIHPYPPASGNNPAISVNHFFVPAAIAAALGLQSGAPATRSGAQP